MQCSAVQCSAGRCLLSREGRTSPACHHIQLCHPIRNQHHDIYDDWAGGGCDYDKENFLGEDPGFFIWPGFFYPNFGNWLGGITLVMKGHKLLTLRSRVRRKYVGLLASLIPIIKCFILVLIYIILQAKYSSSLFQTICKADKRLGREKADVKTFGGMTDSVSWEEGKEGANKAVMNIFNRPSLPRPCSLYPNLPLRAAKHKQINKQTNRWLDTNTNIYTVV